MCEPGTYDIDPGAPGLLQLSFGLERLSWNDTPKKMTVILLFGENNSSMGITKDKLFRYSQKWTIMLVRCNPQSYQIRLWPSLLISCAIIRRKINCICRSPKAAEFTIFRVERDQSGVHCSAARFHKRVNLFIISTINYYNYQLKWT